MTAMSLHVGLNAVDPAHYTGWAGELTGCENDAHAMAGIASGCGHATTVLLTGAATADRVLRELARAAGLLRPGDSFLLTVAGHGTQVPGGDPSETDGRDEALVLHDRMLLDDELNAALSAFAPGVRLEMVADCCHSGTVTRRMAAATRFLPRDLAADVVAAHPGIYDRARRTVRGRTPDVLLLSACQDDEVTGDGPVNGEFTAALLRTWDGGSFTGDFREFRKRIDDLLPEAQNPGLRAWTTAADRLTDERPFRTTQHTIEKEIAMPTATLSNGTAPAVTPAADRIPEGMPPELAARIDLSRLVDPTAGLDSPTAVQTLIELSGARPIPASRSTSGFHFFWWGMNLRLSHDELESVLVSADAVATLTTVVGGVVPDTVKPYLGALVAFIRASAGVLRGMDQGFGVYISMSWFAVGVFVPTPVREGDRSAARSGELVVNVPPFPVRRNGGDQDTGLIIQPGQRLVISAEGSVWSGIWLTQENGPSGWGGWAAGEEAPMPGQPPFSLIGRLDGRTFFVGGGLTWVHSGQPARLSFLINDHRRIGSGAFSVRVDVFAP